MNKYQEALDTLLCKAHTNHEECEANRCAKDEICLRCDYKKAYEPLKELVEKATPKKVAIEMITDGFDDGDFGGTFEYKKATCPICKGILIDETEEVDLEGYDYCPNCQQALDWSDEE